jgi:hypothetical protein
METFETLSILFLVPIGPQFGIGFGGRMDLGWFWFGRE